MNSSGLFRAVFVVVLTLYPLIVYLGIRHLPVSFFALLLLLLLLLRWNLILPTERRIMLPMIGGLSAFALATALTGSQALLLAYPVLVNLALCTMFAKSLASGDPLLLRVARARHMEIPAIAVPYLRRLTAIWAVFFAVNAVLALITTQLSIEIWVVYNGLVSYIIVALLIVGEMVFRRYYKRRLGT